MKTVDRIKKLSKKRGWSLQKVAEEATADVERNIKMKLLDRDMTQAELSRLLNINRQQVNRAIKGDNSPKAIEIRKKIYRVLDM